MSAEVRERFARIVNDPEEQLDLAEAALLIAKEEQPDLDIEVYLRRLDELAAAVRRIHRPWMILFSISTFSSTVKKGYAGTRARTTIRPTVFSTKCSIAKL